jgi:hypothetical protein
MMWLHLKRVLSSRMARRLIAAVLAVLVEELTNGADRYGRRSPYGGDSCGGGTASAGW